MDRDTLHEALDNIQDVANYLATSDELPPEVAKGLEIIEALARHSDKSDPLNPEDNEWLARIKRAKLDDES